MRSHRYLAGRCQKPSIAGCTIGRSSSGRLYPEAAFVCWRLKRALPLRMRLDGGLRGIHRVAEMPSTHEDEERRMRVSPREVVEQLIDGGPNPNFRPPAASGGCDPRSKQSADSPDPVHDVAMKEA